MLGREAGDWGEGRTAALLAEHLELPFVAFVDEIQNEGDETRVQRQTDFGNETLAVRPPLVLSITNNDSNVPRIPKTRDIMMAHRKELTTLTLQDVELTEDAVRQQSAAIDVVDLFVPQKTIDCEFVDADSPEERVAAFAEKIAAVLRAV